MPPRLSIKVWGWELPYWLVWFWVLDAGGVTLAPGFGIEGKSAVGTDSDDTDEIAPVCVWIYLATGVLSEESRDA